MKFMDVVKVLEPRAIDIVEFGSDIIGVSGVNRTGFHLPERYWVVYYNPKMYQIVSSSVSSVANENWGKIFDDSVCIRNLEDLVKFAKVNIKLKEGKPTKWYY